MQVGEGCNIQIITSPRNRKCPSDEDGRKLVLKPAWRPADSLLHLVFGFVLVNFSRVLSFLSGEERERERERGESQSQRENQREPAHGFVSKIVQHVELTTPEEYGEPMMSNLLERSDGTEVTLERSSRGAPDRPSGFGFELTFRLKKEPDETGPPTWPAELMQALARYVFHSENTLCAGDHVSWHAPLDGNESRIQHMLLTSDPQLQPLRTPLGTVAFLQIVGVCQEELQAAQRWNGVGMLHLLASTPCTGGAWLITDMRRGESLFEINPTQQERIEQGVQTEGSNLSGVSARCCWEDESLPGADGHDIGSPILDSIPPRLGAEGAEAPWLRLDNSTSNESQQWGWEGQRAGRRSVGESEASVPPVPHELVRTRTIAAVSLRFNLEAGLLLPLALRGRILHGRHFTFKSIAGDAAITMVASGVEGAFVGPECPYAAHGPWLQIFIPERFARRILMDLQELVTPTKVSFFTIFYFLILTFLPFNEISPRTKIRSERQDQTLTSNADSIFACAPLNPFLSGRSSCPGSSIGQTGV
uniref:Suppressor of fused homolog n=1 Tax=Eptatretus burgeri TaxID=7764 RepID=A0A8C4Q1Y1_EPTBU